MTKIGTLAEIGAKPGDTVTLVENGIIAGKDVGKLGVVFEYGDGDLCTRGHGMDRVDSVGHKFRIVSRAEATPKLWRDMTPEEKGALLLAHQEGKDIEIRLGTLERGEWRVTCHPWWKYDNAYRIKPEPKVETVNQGYKTNSSGRFVTTSSLDHATHVVTFNLIDGKPDCTSIKMEKLQ